LLEETLQICVAEFPAGIATLLIGEVATGSDHDQLGDLSL
jgi:hypothetical protein